MPMLSQEETQKLLRALAEALLVSLPFYKHIHNKCGTVTNINIRGLNRSLH